MVCSELGLHIELANSILSQSGVILGPWRAQTWPLDPNRLLTSYYTPILRPPSTPTLPPYYYPHPPTLLLPPVILLPARKKMLKTGQILGIRNVYTHWVIASEHMNNWCKFCLHSCRHWEVITQWFLKIAISPNKALCVEALFCQIQSHLTIQWNLSIWITVL